MFAGKADNEVSYLRAPAGGTDNNQHLQMYFSKIGSHRTVQALTKAVAARKQLGNS